MAVCGARTTPSGFSRHPPGRRDGRRAAVSLDEETKLLRAEGLSEYEATRQARLRFGGVERVKEEVREARGIRLFENLVNDLRFGIRMLRKRPGFTTVAVLSLAIGIGANTAIFSLVNAIILRSDLEMVDRPEELVDLFLKTDGWDAAPLSYPDIEDLREETAGVFDGFAEAHFDIVQVDRGQGVEGVLVEIITGDYFPTLGVRAALGRAIGPQDDRRPGGHPVVMLTHGYWRERFASDPEVVGRELRLNGQGYTIIGVAPEAYPGSGRYIEPRLYIPVAMVNELSGFEVLASREENAFFGKARLAAGVTRPQAETAVAAVAASLDAERPEGWEVGTRFVLVPTTDVLITPMIDPYLRQAAGLLMVVVGLILLVSCTNLAGYLLARGRDRRQEMSVRLALGASRATIVRQLLTETTLLGALGGVAGVGLAMWSLRALLQADLPLPVDATLSLDVGLDRTVLAFTVGVSMVAGVLLGLVPALQTTRPDLVSSLKNETTGSGQPGQVRWRNALVITQLTVSLVLLIGAGLFLRNFQKVLAVDPGFGHAPTAVARVELPPYRYSLSEAHQLAGRLSDRFRELPGVESVGLTSVLPLDMLRGGTIQFQVAGHLPSPGQDAFTAAQRAVDAGFFDALGIPIVDGRGVSEADGPDAPPVAVVSETTARRFWPDGRAVGQTLHSPDTDGVDLRIVGVARDVKVRSIGEAPTLMVYQPYRQTETRGVSFVARTSLDPAQTALSLLTAGREIEPELEFVETETLARHLLTTRLPAQLGAFALSAFAALALVLSVVGLYGVVSYGVAARKREVGIRMALGANATTIARQLAGNGVRLVLVSGAIGLTLSVMGARLLSGLLFGIDTTDPVTLIGAPLVLLLTAALASYLPARRASRANPVTALRSD